MSPLSKDETRRVVLTIQYVLSRDQNGVYVFSCMVLLAVRIVADVTETRNVIPSVEFKTTK